MSSTTYAHRPSTRTSLTNGDAEIIAFWLWTAFWVGLLGVIFYTFWHVQEDEVTLYNTSAVSHSTPHIVQTSKGAFELSSLNPLNPFMHGGKTSMSADITFEMIEELPPGSKVVVKHFGWDFGPFNTHTLDMYPAE